MDAIEQLEQTAKARWSCRAYKPNPVPEDIITKITKTAQHAPSWCNAQPWQLVITRGQETDRFRTALYDHAQGAAPSPDMEWPTGYPGVYGERRRTCGWQLYDAVGIVKGDRDASAHQMMENYRLFGAPHVAILHSPADLGAYGAMDCGGFVSMFCLAAQAMGVATIPQAAIAAHAPFVRDWFQIAKDRTILCAISFGYADMDHPANSFRTDREDVQNVIAWKV
ncbi:MAG: nitroreductase [Paracoccaceae bacterium]